MIYCEDALQMEKNEVITFFDYRGTAHSARVKEVIDFGYWVQVLVRLTRADETYLGAYEVLRVEEGKFNTIIRYPLDNKKRRKKKL